MITRSQVRRRRAIVENAKPTKRSPNGLWFNLRIGVYDIDGHVAIDDPEVADSCLNCADDLLALSEIAQVLHLVRERQRMARQTSGTAHPRGVVGGARR
jgi:hypothetical protein